MARIDEIRKAVAEYGRRSVEYSEIVHDLGRRILLALDDYLIPGGGVVFGVPPTGEWDPGVDYRDAIFSSFGKILDLEDVCFGIAIRIDNLSDSGSLWVRLPTTIRKEGERLKVFAGTTKGVWLSIPREADDLQAVCEHLFEVVLAAFQNDVRFYLHGSMHEMTIGFLRP
jgi:hypothetical protein